MASWTATDMHSLHPEIKKYNLRKNRGITPNEINMMQKVTKRLHNKTILYQFNDNYIRHGVMCTSTERHRQSIAVKYATMGICTEESAYKIAHMGFPTAKVFVDIGCNKGYTTALIAGLWQGYSSGLAPYLLFKKYEETNVFQSALSPAGYCRTGLDRAFPLYCPVLAQREAGAESSREPVASNRHKDGQCDHQQSSVDSSSAISVYAVDGSSAVANSFRSTLSQMSPFNTSALAMNIQVSHLAMSHKEGVVRFTTIDESMASGYEGGGIVGRRMRNRMLKREEPKRGSEQVQMTTLNSFADKNNIKNKIDFIKIDAEGHDLDVVRGANETMAAVGIIMWEQGKSTKQLFTTLKYLERLFFDCYIPDLKGFVKLTNGCFHVSKIPSGNNIVCASRVNAPGAALAFDLLSYYHDDGM